MIDLTPLDVRKKAGDFRRILRGYDPQEVDIFLELVAERMEVLVRENMALKERSEGLARQVESQTGREQAVHEALVTAQELRTEIHEQARREAELIVGKAEEDARRRIARTESELEVRRAALDELERRRVRFLRAFRMLLERELDVVAVEEENQPLEARAVELDLGGGQGAATEAAEAAGDAGAAGVAEEHGPGEVEGAGGRGAATDRAEPAMDTDSAVAAASPPPAAPPSPAPVWPDDEPPSAEPASPAHEDVPTFEELLGETEPDAPTAAPDLPREAEPEREPDAGPLFRTYGEPPETGGDRRP